MAVSEQRTWAAVEFSVGLDDEELAGWVMVDRVGASGCEVRPVPESAHVLIHATFANCQPDMSKIRKTLEEYGLPATELKLCSIAEEDWLAKWKEGFKPFNSGDRLVVCPPWERETAVIGAFGREVLVIEPAMAFGTGLHATTRFCLRSIERQTVGDRVLDVGTGSGILAIAAVLLHPHALATAVDNDPVATENAQLNCRLNNVGSRVKLITGTIDSLAGHQFDSILSNITCEDIIALLPQYRELLKPGGIVICAGILSEKRPLLEESLPEHGFTIASSEQDGQWTGIILRRA